MGKDPDLKDEANELQIRIEGRVFSLGLENLNGTCVKELRSIFKDSPYTLERLLTVCVHLVRERSAIQIKTAEILKKYDKYRE